jgi:hypothetical protein
MKKPAVWGDAPKGRHRTISGATSSSARHEAGALNTSNDSGSPPWHWNAPPRPIDHQHHRLGPPSQLATAHTRVRTLNDLDTQNPSSRGQTARRPRRRRGLKLKPPSMRHADRSDSLATLATQNYHPTHYSTPWSCWPPCFPRPSPRRTNIICSGPLSWHPPI